MAIIRSKRDVNFTVIDNCVFERNKLSFAAMGMLGYLLSKPDNWSVSATELTKVTDGTAKKSGRDAVYSLLDELMAAGFVIRTKKSNGKMDYTVFDKPVTDNPYYGKDVLREIPITEKPVTDNPTLVNTETTTSTEKEVVSTDMASQEATPTPQPEKIIPPTPEPPLPEEPPKLRNGTRLPDDWVLSDGNYQYAAGKGLDHQTIQDESEKFLNYWTSKTGVGATKLNWDKTWQNWILGMYKKISPSESSFVDMDYVDRQLKDAGLL